MTVTSSPLNLSENSVLYDPSMHNGSVVFIDLSLSSSLAFEDTIHKASHIVSQGGNILWHLHFDIHSTLDKFYFEGFFNSHYHGIKTFLEKVYSLFQKESLGCILFQGSCEFASYFNWNGIHYENFIDWLIDLYGAPAIFFESSQLFLKAPGFKDFSLEMFETHPFGRHLQNLYSAEVFAGYFHRLAAALPDDTLAWVSLDTRQFERGGLLDQLFMFHLLSKERFAHLNLILKGEQALSLQTLQSHQGNIVSLTSSQDIKVGICFPTDQKALPSVFHALRKACHALDQKGIAYKLIPEPLITESWEGLEVIVFMSQALSIHGKRILQGFSITSGLLLYLDSPIGLETECHFNDFSFVNFPNKSL